MSQESVETVNRVVEAFNTRGLDAALAAPARRVLGGNFDEYRLDLERVVDLGGNRALALLVQHGRIKTGGSPMELAVGWIVEVLDGQLARVDVHFSWESALEAAGLAE